MIRLKGGCLITPYRMENGKDLYVDNEKICSCERTAEEDVQEIDLNGLYVAPGFVDLHIHGGGGHEFWSEDPREIKLAGKFHLEHGTTSVMPTVNYGTQLDYDAEKGKFEAYRNAVETDENGPEYLGLHLEGPFVSPGQPMVPGQQVVPAVPEIYRRYLDDFPMIQRWTLAPEIPGTKKLARELIDRGIYVSVGHSDADYNDVCDIFEIGATHATHLYSGMNMVHRVEGRRFPGVLESVFLLEDMYAEVIANGAHLSGELLRLVYQQKGPGRVCVVSDATSMSGSPDGPVFYNGKMGIIDDGVILREDRSGFMGSAITYDRMLYNLIYRAGIPIQDAVRMCSTTPARSVGMGTRKGVLAPGYDADIVVFDKDIKIKMVMAKGRIVYKNI